jgi:hypothetical protein
MSETSAPSVASSSAPLVRTSGGARVLAADLRFVFIVLNQARYRLLAQLFGTSKDQADLLTLVAALLLVEVMRKRWQRLMSGPIVPSSGDAMLGLASVRELLYRVAGPSLRDTPQLGTLLTVAFLGRAIGPTMVRSIRVIRGGSQRVNSSFRRRYGYLVDVGQQRREHFEELARRRREARQHT